MIQHQMDKVVSAIPTAAGTSAVTLVVDTRGWDHCSFVAMRASNAATTFASVLKVEDSEDNVTYGNVSGLVGGTDFTIAAVSDTASAAAYKIDVSTQARKRYLRLTVTPSVSVNVAASARLSRGEQSPVSASEAGVIGWVVG